MQAVANVLTAIAELQNALDALQEQVDGLPPEHRDLVSELEHWLVTKARGFRGDMRHAHACLAYDTIQRELNALASRQERDRVAASWAEFAALTRKKLALGE